MLFFAIPKYKRTLENIELRKVQLEAMLKTFQEMNANSYQIALQVNLPISEYEQMRHKDELAIKVLTKAIKAYEALDRALEIELPKLIRRKNENS